ncbi:MAG: ATPase [Peptococcaceae bacterium]|nr:ATPase [Peptococcaceae bacterium]
MKKVRHLFAGGNTGSGFYSFYDNLVALGKRRVYVLKGGPGTGKSSFMKKLAAELLDAGHDVDMFFCSSDSESLDGIAVTALGIVVLDGTAPHMVDPRFPGSVEKMINLADCLNMEPLKRQSEAVRECTERNSWWFRRAYCYLRAAMAVAEDIEHVHWGLVDQDGLRDAAYYLEKKIFSSDLLPNRYKRKSRHFFASAYTPAGYVDHTPSILQGYENICYLEGRLGSGRTFLMEHLMERANLFGLEYEAFHMPLLLRKISLLAFPELGLAITSNEVFQQKHWHFMDLNQTVDMEKLDALKESLSPCQSLLDNLTAQAVMCLSEAKKVHDELENFYIPNMNFEGVQKVYSKVREEVFQMHQA